MEGVEQAADEHDKYNVAFVRETLDSAGSVIYTIDRSFRVTTVNAEWDAFAVANGGSQLLSARVVGTNLLDWLQEPARGETRAVCERLFRGESPRFTRDFDCSSPTQRRDCRLVISPLHGEDGYIVGATFVSSNITQRNVLEEEIGVRNRQLAALVDQLQEQHVVIAKERDHAQAVARVITTLNKSLSVDATVNTLLTVATDMVDVSAAAVYLLSEARDRYVPWGNRGLDLQASDMRAFELATSAAGHALAQGEPFDVPDTAVRPDLQFPLLADGQQPGSVYVTPITIFEGPIGVLEVYGPKGRSFGPNERTVLGTLAASAGIAITNARLFGAEVRAREDAQQLARVADERAAQQSAMISAMSDGVWMCDRAGTIMTVNDAGLKMLNLSRSDVVGKPMAVLSRLFAVRSGERRRLGLRVALQGETVRAECEVILPETGQTRVIDLYAAPVHTASSAILGAVTVVRDITEAKQLERVRDDFLSVAAHELKTPMTALKGYTQLALRRLNKQGEVESVRKTLQTIDQQSDRVTNLVDKILDVSRVHAGKLELQQSRFDIQELIEAVVQQVERKAADKTIRVQPHPPVPVFADPRRIEQVIYNVLDNAIKYSPPGSAASVATETRDNIVYVSVHDEGMGISSESLPYIFDRWYQAHDASHGDLGGMGLGLYLSKEIVDLHGGSMWASSREASGTTVGFTLPCVLNDALS